MLPTVVSHAAYPVGTTTTAPLATAALAKLPQQPLQPSAPSAASGNNVPTTSNANAAAAAAVPLPPCDDKEGHYIVTPNESLTQRCKCGHEGCSRVKIMRLLGQGTFGKVAHCWDRQTRRYCAVKIIRAVQKYRDASRIEIRVLRELQRWDPENQYRCIHLRECFDYRNHICMVFDLLGQSVFDFMKSNHFAPFPAEHIQQLAQQLITSVAFLHRIGLVHTDLKPENILLVNDAAHTTEIRLIDFGSATFEKEYHSAVVCTRHYRAPEIILGCGWSYPCDMWSIGCILVELFTGEALFQTHDNLEHLAMMEAAIGPMPSSLIQRANHAGREFFRHGRLAYPASATTRASRKYVAAMRRLENIVVPNCPFNIYLLDLVQRMLIYDPAERITAEEALRQPFFQLRLPAATNTLAASLSSVDPSALAGAMRGRTNYGVLPPAAHPPAFVSKASMHGQAYG
ncbi:kinase-like domain-containing protein [Thamnocephalis sphaerospora]|uniref:Kinase-like domain-containing protein n=1 Tax=Thamnocephalis sphaerospora TaxID=78915 RepID=A0A4V1IW52_9FUNG|nr:kinase-like domain-containing protein [Thamnocephalis sphaerospora]|eukprot:RKP06349.1 kinase-like domain-containing protein [Thamnocephalis sphaerospora]